STLMMPFWLALKAEALHLADRTSQALEAISEAEALVERFENRHWCAELRGSGVCFSRLWVLRRPKLRLRSGPPLAQQRSRSRFRWRDAPRQRTPNTVAKKRADQEDVDFDYLFGNAQSGNCVFLLLVLVLLNGRHVTISVYPCRQPF